MVTISNTAYTSNIDLATVYMAMTKARMMDICKKLDLYVSPNLKKEETARRVAREVLDNPIAILCELSKSELLLLDEIMKAGSNSYITKKIRKTPFKLQKFGLVLTHEDIAENEWHMIMPDSVRESLSVYAAQYLELAQKGQHLPSPKDFRFQSMLNTLYGENDK